MGADVVAGLQLHRSSDAMRHKSFGDMEERERDVSKRLLFHKTTVSYTK